MSYHFTDFAGAKFGHLKIKEFKLGEVYLSNILELGFSDSDQDLIRKSMEVINKKADDLEFSEHLPAFQSKVLILVSI